MKRILVLFLPLFLFVSCTFYPQKTVTVSFFSDSPWEEASGREFWYKVRCFDGEKVKVFYLDSGEKSFSLKVRSGRCALFAAYPLGSLSPFGGFWQGNGEVYLYPEWGSCISALLDAAEERPGAVAELDMAALLKAEPDLRCLDVVALETAVFRGTLTAEKLKRSKLYPVPLEGVLQGRWISLLSWSDSFVVSSIRDDNVVKLYPGVWYYLSLERNLMLQVILTEEGECRTRLTSPPLWY